MKASKKIIKKNRTNMISGIFYALLEHLGNLIHNSLFLSWIFNYSRIENNYSGSRTSTIVSHITKLKYKTLYFKNKCSEFAEKSILIRMFDRIVNTFFSTSLRSVGLFMFSSGTVIIAAFSVNYTDRLLKLDYSNTFLMGCILILASLFFIPIKNKNIAMCIRDSKILSYFLVDNLRTDHLYRSEAEKINPTTIASLFFGIVFGVISYSVSPLAVLFVLFATAEVYLVMTQPENGILILCLTLPIQSEKMIVFLMAITTVSMLFKAVRGKRSLKAGLPIGTAFVVCIILLVSAVFSFDQANAFSECKPILIATIFMIMVMMTVQSSKLSEKCFKMLGCSLLITAILGVKDALVELILHRHSKNALHYVFSKDIGASILGSTEVFTAFLVFLIPLLLIKNNGYSKLLKTTSLIAAVLCLIITNSYNASYALFISILISMILFSKSGIVFTFVLGTVIVALNTFFPFIFEKLSSAFSIYFNTPVNNTTSNITGFADFFAKYGFSGVGFGNNSVLNSSISNNIHLQTTENQSIYLDMFMKLGIPMMLIFIFVMMLYISRIISFSLTKYQSVEAKRRSVSYLGSIISAGVWASSAACVYDLKLCVLLFLIIGLANANIDSAKNDYIPPDAYIDQ